MLKQHKLLIDKHCPMCKAYGYCFTQLKMVDDQTVTPYQDIDIHYTNAIDMERAKNEIALLDTTNNATKYGIDAMIHLVANQSTFLNACLRFKPIYFALNQLYKFISYNRKLIIPAAVAPSFERDCEPDVNLKYRWTYLVLTALFTGLVLNSFFAPVFAALNLSKPWYLEYLICFGQIGWQGSVISLVKKDRAMDYLGNMSTVSNMGALLLIPALLLNGLFVTWWMSIIYFAGIVAIMLLEHLRRCSLLNLPLTMTVSWVGFRTLILLIIISLNI